MSVKFGLWCAKITPSSPLVKVLFDSQCFLFYAANNPPTLTVQGGTEIIVTAGTTRTITVTVDDKDAGDTATLEKVNNTVLNTDCITITGMTAVQYTVTIDTSDLLHCDVA